MKDPDAITSADVEGRRTCYQLVVAVALAFVRFGRASIGAVLPNVLQYRLARPPQPDAETRYQKSAAIHQRQPPRTPRIECSLRCTIDVPCGMYAANSERIRLQNGSAPI